MAIEKTVIALPSLCKVYKDVDPNAIKIRPFTGKEEKLIAEITGDNFNKRFFQVLSNVLEGIDPAKLTIGDRNYLMLWLAINSYSKMLPMNFTCENCFSKLDMQVDLSGLQVRTLPEDFVEPMAVILPSGPTINMRLLRVEDEMKLVDLEKANQNTWLYKIAMSMVNDASVLDRVMALEDTSSKDIATLRAFHEQYEHGPVLKTNYVCERCGGEGTLPVPFRIEMFLPYGENLKQYFRA